MAVAVSLVAAAEHPMAAAVSLAVAMAAALPMVAVEVVAHLTAVVAAANPTAVAAATHTPRHWLAVTRRAFAGQSAAHSLRREWALLYP
jgi:hypothetical protein